MLTLGAHAVWRVSGCVFYDLMTLSYTELEHVQSHQYMPVEWVWSINHRHAEQKTHDTCM